MQQAAYRAGLAFTRANVGYVHAVAHALGGRYGIAHGACCAVAMPAVLRAYGEKAHVALAALADAAGVTQGSASAQQTSNKAEALIRAIESLNRKLGLPETFAQIRAEDIPTLAAQAAAEGNLFYPAPKILSEAELADVLLRLSEPQTA
jgi:alcohol dehydrogenase class IV